MLRRRSAAAHGRGAKGRSSPPDRTHCRATPGSSRSMCARMAMSRRSARQRADHAGGLEPRAHLGIELQLHFHRLALANQLADLHPVFVSEIESRPSAGRLPDRRSYRRWPKTMPTAAAPSRRRARRSLRGRSCAGCCRAAGCRGRPALPVTSRPCNRRRRRRRSRRIPVRGRRRAWTRRGGGPADAA